MGNALKGITIKLPEETLRRLKEEARATRRSLAALIRDRLSAEPQGGRSSVHALVSDLAGSVAGTRRAATNTRARFHRR